jgi:hypothetical protein
VKNGETDNDGLHEKENGVELMISLVSCDRSGYEAGEVDHAADEVLRPG